MITRKVDTNTGSVGVGKRNKLKEGQSSNVKTGTVNTYS